MSNEIEVWPDFIRILKHELDASKKLGARDIPTQEQILAACKARHALGMSKYGRSLTTNNGRVALQDLYEELLDGIAYCWQDRLEQGMTNQPDSLRGVFHNLLDAIFKVTVEMENRANSKEKQDANPQQ